MSLHEALRQLIEELDRTHPNGVTSPGAWNVTERNVLPNFTVAANGQERFFTTNALAALRDLVAVKYENDRNVASIMDRARFGKIVKSCVADLHAAGRLIADRLDESHNALNGAIKSRVAQLPLTFTHYFPNWTLGMEAEKPFPLGPVMFMTREQWIDTVDFPPETIQRYRSKSEVNGEWKTSLKTLLSEERASKGADRKAGLAGMVYRAIRDCPSLLQITVEGYELDLSRKVAEIVCKSALDSISLLLGGKDYFYQQALAHERLPPMETSCIVEMDGHLWFPGLTASPRVRGVTNAAVGDYLAQNTECLDALANILNALVDPRSASHPDLAKRWSTALDWYAEGQRERNDAVSLAKIATSLDVMSCGGKVTGILQMLESLFGADKSTIIVKGRSPLTLMQVVKSIYDKGRSQILHGTEFDRLKSFEASRSHATVIARIALLEAAVRLKAFKGPDESKQFRSMPK